MKTVCPAGRAPSDTTGEVVIPPKQMKVLPLLAHSTRVSRMSVPDFRSPVPRRRDGPPGKPANR
jgi:hypothetical protein